MFFFFNDTATTEIYTLSLHDALPIWKRPPASIASAPELLMKRGVSTTTFRLKLSMLPEGEMVSAPVLARRTDRKSTRLNSSHANISYAVFCLKKKKNKSVDQT